MQSFTTGHVDNVCVRRCDGDGADGLRGLGVKDGVPRPAEIVTLPDAAVDLSDVKHIRLARHTRRSAGSSPSKRADLTPMELRSPLRVLCGGDERRMR